MTHISRRTILGGIASAAGGIAATAVPVPALAAIEDPVSPQERLKAALEELKAAASAVYPDITHWDMCIGDEIPHCRVFIATFSQPATYPEPVEWSGAGFYEVEQGDKRPIYWIERVDYKTVPGHYFRAVMRWKGRDQGKPFRIHAGNLRIVRKLEDYAGA